jgi:hypothetical protein
MGIESALLQMGFRPKGTGPSTLSNVLGGLSDAAGGLTETVTGIQKKQQDDYDKKMEKIAKDKQAGFDMYKTLRNYGYSPESAYDAIEKEYPSMKGVLPDPSGVTGPITKGKASVAKPPEYSKEQETSRRIGKQQVIQKLGQWGKSGSLSDQKGLVAMPADEDELKGWFIDNPDLSKYFDTEDPDIANAIATSVKARSQGSVDLKAQAKTEGKSIFAKIKEWVGSHPSVLKSPMSVLTEKLGGGKKTTPQANQQKSDPQSRFKELIQQGLSKEDAYKQMVKEGF